MNAFLEERKIAGSLIDPENVEFTWGWAEMLDRYRVDAPPREYSCFGRVHSVRTPGSEIWVEFSDLSEAVRERLWQRLGNRDLKERDSIFDDEDDLTTPAASLPLTNY